MKYSWDMDNIKYHKKQYEKALRYSRKLTKEDKDIFRRGIRDFESMENLYKYHELFIFTGKQKYVDRDKMLPKDMLDDYCSVPRFIRDILMDALKGFRNSEIVSDFVDVPRQYFSDEELVEMSLDFCKWLPKKEYQKYFGHFLNESNHLLYFDYFENLDFLGFTFPFFYPSYKPYFLVNRQDTIEDFATLNHEMAHGVFSRNYEDGNHLFYLSELEGYFFDFLSYQYLHQTLGKIPLDDLEYNRLVTEYDNFLSFYVESSAISLFRKGFSIDSATILNKAYQHQVAIELNEDILLETLHLNPQDTANYSISFLTSLDLENIYFKDEEYALHLFEKIRTNSEDNLLDNLRKNHITFMDDGYENLKAKVKTFL